MRSVLILVIMFFLRTTMLNAQVIGNSSTASNKSIDLIVKPADYCLPDTLYLDVYREFYHIRYPDTTKMVIKDVNGYYKFKIINSSNPVYFTLFHSPKSRKELIKLFLAEPGDSVSIVVTTKSVDRSVADNDPSKLDINLSFKGIGVDKYRFQYDRNTFLDTVQMRRNVLTIDNKIDTTSYFDYSLRKLAALLKKYNSSIKQEIKAILALDCFAELELQRMHGLNSEFSIKGQDTFLVNSILQAYYSLLQHHELRFNNSAQLRSAKYPLFIIQRQVLSQMGHSGVNKSLWVFRKLKTTYKGLLHDRVLLAAVAEFNRSKHNEAIMEEALTSVSNDLYLQYLKAFSESNFKGRPAFSFSLPDANGDMVGLGDFKSKVVFIDFWFNGCSACAIYYKNTLSKVEDAFKDNSDVAFVTINVDANKDKWLSGLKQGIYTSGHVINLYAGETGNRERLINGYKVNAYPRPFLIGKDGKIFTGDYNLLKSGPAKLIETINTALGRREDSILGDKQINIR